ncbi:MAG: sugar transferase [Desulfobacterales bacterium]
MKRLFDLIISLLLLIILILPVLVISFLIKSTSRGPILYWSDRVGINNSIFKMPKFRTMQTNTPAVATHLLTNPEKYVTSAGRWLRKTSLDELPQIFSVIKGDMSFVGPRPALFNQDDLVALRTSKGVHTLIPGITGWAQINGRDELPIPVKVDYDYYYLQNRSFLFDLKILAKTVINVLFGKGVQH